MEANKADSTLSVFDTPGAIFGFACEELMRLLVSEGSRFSAGPLGRHHDVFSFVHLPIACLSSRRYGM